MIESEQTLHSRSEESPRKVTCRLASHMVAFRVLTLIKPISWACRFIIDALYSWLCCLQVNTMGNVLVGCSIAVQLVLVMLYCTHSVENEQFVYAS